MSYTRAPASRASPGLSAALIVALLAVQHAGAASVLRPSPRLVGPGAELLQTTQQGDVLDGLDAVALQALNDLTALGAVQDDAGTLDVLVDVWGLDDAAAPDGNKPSQRISLPSLPHILPNVKTACSCEHWHCGCCATLSLASLKRNDTGCASVSFVKERLAVVLRLALNNRTLLERELISGSDPPPFCFPIPQLPFISVCLRFNNITVTDERKFQACGALELGLPFANPLVRLRFGCLRIGPGGVDWSSKPAPHALFSGTDIEADAFQQFAAAMNATDKEQLLLLHSILRQKSSGFDQPQPVQTSRSSKILRPTYQQGIRYE